MYVPKLRTPRKVKIFDAQLFERNLIKELGFPSFCHNTQNEIEQRKQSSDSSSMNVTGSKHGEKQREP